MRNPAGPQPAAMQLSAGALRAIAPPPAGSQVAQQAGHIDHAGGHERDNQHRVHRRLQESQFRA